jgi:stringent starvation protein B
MSSTIRLPPKKDVALALLENSSVFIHLDPRVEDVMVPPWFKEKPRLVLQIGLNMPVPIQDLNLDEDSVSCTLSFNRSPHFCRIPWSSVFALVGEDGRGMVWPDDIPPEVAAEMQNAQQKQPARSHLRAVEEPAPSKPAREPDHARQKRAKKRAARAAQGERSERPKRQPAALRASEATPPSPAESPRASAEGADKKAKRELPPYLRIVK